MLIFWLVSLLFYWSKFQSLGTVVILLGAGVELYNKKNLSFRNVTFTLLFVFVVILSSVLSEVYNGNNIENQNIRSLAHLVFLCCAFTFLNLDVYNDKYVRIFVIAFALTAIVFSLVGVFIFNDVFYYTSAFGVSRFQYIFGEPSYLAIYSCILLYLSYFYVFRVDDRYLKLVECSLIFCVLLTGSGSGFLILGLVLFLKYKISLRIFFLVLICGALVFYLLPPSLHDFIVHRTEQVISGDLGASTRIRFVAPIDALSIMLNESPFFGFGLMNYQQYMLEHYNDFISFIKVDAQGVPYNNTNIDNAWVLLMFTNGLLGSILVFIGIINRIINKMLDIKSFMVFSFTLFFIGAFVNPLFLGLLYGNWKQK
ncbi:membrane hypothetical protein [Vibrio chagasii]|uniref:O-antigen ligase family protein n=1 Tax=Vibrio chagasii TaxID=170679 RepID=UPI00338B27D7|nr:membrane hypothetical protein [Vibrio chagasii]